MPLIPAPPITLSASEYGPRMLGERHVNQSVNTTHNGKQKPVARRVNFALDNTHLSVVTEREPATTNASDAQQTVHPGPALLELREESPSAAQPQPVTKDVPPQPAVPETQAPRTGTITAATTTAAAADVLSRKPRTSVVTMAPVPLDPAVISHGPFISAPTITPRSVAGSVAHSVSSRRTGPFVVPNSEGIAYASNVVYNAGTHPSLTYLRDQQDRNGPLFTYYTAIHRRMRVSQDVVPSFQKITVCTPMLMPTRAAAV